MGGLQAHFCSSLTSSLLQPCQTPGASAPTDLALVGLPRHEAAMSLGVPHADLARVGATIKKSVGTVAERGQLHWP